jgi:hypothetical protein
MSFSTDSIELSCAAPLDPCSIDPIHIGASQMNPKSSGLSFYLVDIDGNHRVPYKVMARHGPYGYALHPTGKGNDPKAAKYTEDERELVQAVVLHGRGVRARVIGGSMDGQPNTVVLGKQSIRGYWLCPTRMDWVAGAKQRPINEPMPS